MHLFLYLTIFSIFLGLNGISAEDKGEFELNLPLVPNVLPQIKNLSRIPAGYEVVPGIGALKINLRRVPWNRGRNLCIQEGAHLVVINSTAEARIFLQLARELNVQEQLWLGVHDIFKEGDWITIQDEPLPSIGWSKWGPSQPDDYSHTENCGTLSVNSNGGIHDNNCAFNLPFICKIALS